MSNVNTEIRGMSHRESVQDYNNYINRRKSQIAHEQKIEFEDSLKESANRTVKSNTGLFGSGGNIFEQQVTKDTKILIDLNRRKHKVKETTVDMITNMNDEELSRYEGALIHFNLTK